MKVDEPTEPAYLYLVVAEFEQATFPGLPPTSDSNLELIAISGYGANTGYNGLARASDSYEGAILGSAACFIISYWQSC